jgi:hypothetical protein
LWTRPVKSTGGRESGGGPDPRAEHAQPRPGGGESSRRDPAPDHGAARYAQPEAELGGADNVQKTTYVVGEGTEPAGRPRGDYVARGAGGGMNVGVWIVGGIAALIALVYVIGIFR